MRATRLKIGDRFTPPGFENAVEVSSISPVMYTEGEEANTWSSYLKVGWNGDSNDPSSRLYVILPFDFDIAIS